MLRERIRPALRWLIALSFVGVGVTHFTAPDPFLRIIPASLPFPLALVYISGAAEILGGLGLLLPTTRRWAAWGLLLLLIAVYPANINMLVNDIYLDGMPHERWLLWARMPLQLVFALGVYEVGLARPQSENP